jgi:uncharacterized SAM-binding protein YcdF (DUF218 family)
VIPDSLPPALAQGVRAVRAVRRRPWEGELPVGPLAAAQFPKLVISGNHSPAFEAVCDALAARLKAARLLAARLKASRAHLTGAGHATPRDRRCVQPDTRGIHAHGLPGSPTVTSNNSGSGWKANTGRPLEA